MIIHTTHWVFNSNEDRIARRVENMKKLGEFTHKCKGQDEFHNKISKGDKYCKHCGEKLDWVNGVEEEIYDRPTN